jgi:thymidine phosphorylase
MAVVRLGGGRRHEAEGVDHAVGLSEVAAPGEHVGRADRPLAIVHARDEVAAQRAIADLRAAYAVGERRAGDRPAILERLAPRDPSSPLPSDGPAA